MSECTMSDEFDGLGATEKAGIGATLNRCRALAAKIGNELRNKRPEHFFDKLSLAYVHASLERAADVLSTVKGLAPTSTAAMKSRKFVTSRRLALMVSRAVCWQPRHQQHEEAADEDASTGGADTEPCAHC